MKQKQVLVGLRRNQEFLKMTKIGKHQNYSKQEVWGASMSISQPILLWSISTKKTQKKWGKEDTNKLEKHHHSPSYGILQASFANIKPHKPFIHFIKPISCPSS